MRCASLSSWRTRFLPRTRGTQIEKSYDLVRNSLANSSEASKDDFGMVGWSICTEGLQALLHIFLIILGRLANEIVYS